LLHPIPPGRRWPWIRLFGQKGPDAAEPADDAQGAYAQVALELLARCEELHRGWLEQLDEQRRNERLANAAAVYHWYLSSLRERLDAVEAPPALGAWHEALAAALDSMARATQVLSHGYRFHNVRRICDGGLLLEEALAQAVAVRDALGRLCELEPVSAPVPAERSAGF
jgi:GAF domain-containing protein